MSFFNKCDTENVYASLMDSIDELYFNMGEPEEIQEGKPDTTTGNYNDEYWDPCSIGDHDGEEDNVAYALNAQLDVVISPLGLDGVRHYYTTTKWDEFVEQAQNLIDEYHNNGSISFY